MFNSIILYVAAEMKSSLTNCSQAMIMQLFVLLTDNKDNQLVKKHMSDENENTTVSVATTFAHSSTETFTHNDSNTHNAVSSHTDMNTCGDRKRYHSSQIREKKQKYDNFGNDLNLITATCTELNIKL